MIDTATELSIEVLDDADPAQRDAVADILEASFANPERYNRQRLLEQLRSAPLPFYRRFLVARRGGQIVAVGGIKAADWATDTHILYLSAVAEQARGQGIARALIMARIAWAMESFVHGRLLVSTAKPRRFARFGFRLVGKYSAQERRLMVLDF